MTLELEGRIHPENGYLRMDLIAGKVGALPIPRAALQSSMRKMMESPQNRAALRLPDNVSDVHVEDGRIVASFK